MASSTLDTEELTETLAEFVKQCLEQNSKPPFLAAAEDRNGSVLLVRYSFRDGKLELTVLAKNCQDDTFTLPVKVIVTDANGAAGRILIRDGSRPLMHH